MATGFELKKKMNRIAPMVRLQTQGFVMGNLSNGHR